MLGLEQWNSTPSSITGTLVRGTERVTSSALFNALEVGPDPSTRQKVGNGLAKKVSPRPSGRDFPELTRALPQWRNDRECDTRNSLPRRLFPPPARPEVSMPRLTGLLAREFWARIHR
jgi:hypothetical protein